MAPFPHIRVMNEDQDRTVFQAPVLWTVIALFLAFVPSDGSAASTGANYYEVRGITEPVNDVLLSTVTTGIISRIHFSEGEFVRAGQVVLELDGRVEELEVKRRTVQLATLTSELQRSELLFATSSSMPLEELDRKRAEVEIARVELAMAEQALARRKVKTPISGTLMLVPVNVGEYSEVGKVVARVVDSREFYATSTVDPDRLRNIERGHAVTLTVSAGGSDVSITGNVVYVAPVIDAASGLLRIRAHFDNPDGLVRPGVAGILRMLSDDAKEN